MITFKAHVGRVYALAFTPDGDGLVTSGCDEVVRLWSLEKRQQLRHWPGSKFWGPIAVSPDGALLGRGGYGIHVWAIDGAAPAMIQVEAFTEAVAFSPDGKVFVAHGNSDHPLTRWAMPSGKIVSMGVLRDSWGGTRESTGGQRFPTGGLAYHPDGTLLAGCFGVLGKHGYDSLIMLWDATTGQTHAELRSSCTAAHPTALRFSPDGTLLAGVYGTNLRVWDVRRESEVTTLSVGKKHFKGLVFTRDGRHLAAVNNDQTVRLWETASWSEVEGFDWNIGKVSAVDVSPDGCRMVAGGSTGKVVVWDVDR